MKQMKKWMLLLSLAAAAACGKIDPTISYGEVSMGNPDGEQFIYMDSGVAYKIVEQQCEGNPLTCDRVLIQCDVLKHSAHLKTSTKTYEVYDIRLLQFREVKIKNPISTETQIGTDSYLGTDPIKFSTGWISGKNLNVFAQWYEVDGSNVEHRINLCFEQARSHGDTLCFSLRHNAFDETPPYTKASSSDAGGGSAAQDKKYVVKSDYYSFSLKNLLPEGKSTIPIKITWKWYRDDDVNQQALDNFSLEGVYYNEEDKTE